MRGLGLGMVACIVVHNIPLTNLGFLGPYYKLRTEVFPVDLWPAL